MNPPTVYALNTRMKESISIHWFRRDLRLEDNHALSRAIQSGKPVLCIFIFDRKILDKLEDKADKRLSFIHSCLQSIHSKLKELGSGLKTYYGEPLEIWKTIIQEHSVSDVFCNRDYEPYAQQRDRSVYEFLEKQGIQMHGCKDHVIFEKDEIVKDDGKPYTVFTPYSKKWKSKLTATSFNSFDSIITPSQLHAHVAEDIISLERMGMEFADNTVYPSAFIAEEIIRNYHLNRDIPHKQGTTRLSLHLRFGTLSVRKLARIGAQLNEKWLNELIWRDFYQMIIYHFPHTVSNAFKPAYDRIPWRDAATEFEAWCAGKTGYPIVDAGMRELNATGFMHNRVRMIVASFLTKHLLIDWRLGERYFAKQLLDFDLGSNVGGWQWAASCGCDAAPYFRVFNPALQTEKFDKELRYIKQWIPEFGTSTYPKPIVDHAFARERVLKVFKEALKSE
jgi:deoxyribodipyrimidine photo-lyase